MQANLNTRGAIGRHKSAAARTVKIHCLREMLHITLLVVFDLSVRIHESLQHKPGCVQTMVAGAGGIGGMRGGGTTMAAKTTCALRKRVIWKRPAALPTHTKSGR